MTRAALVFETPLLMHWSYYNVALSHLNIFSSFYHPLASKCCQLMNFFLAEKGAFYLTWAMPWLLMAVPVNFDYNRSCCTHFPLAYTICHTIFSWFAPCILLWASQNSFHCIFTHSRPFEHFLFFTMGPLLEWRISTEKAYMSLRWVTYETYLVIYLEVYSSDVQFIWCIYNIMH